MRPRHGPMRNRQANASRRGARRFPSFARMSLTLPFSTFGEAADFDLEVEVQCRCGRRVVIDGRSDQFRARRLVDCRFACTTILPHGVRCSGRPAVYIRRRGREGWTLADHSTAMRARHARSPLPVIAGSFGDIVRSGQVAYFYDQGCPSPYTLSAVELDEPPWDRFRDRRVERMICPNCRKGLIMHLHYGPGTPATDRFHER